MIASLLSLFWSALSPQQPVPMPAIPQVPGVTVGNVGNLQRFVDFHADLDRKGAIAVVGQLDKIKEGKREKLKDGVPAGTGAVRVAIGGTQYFKAPAKVAVTARATFVGDQKPKVEFECELQVARDNDGVERYQSRTPENCPIEVGVLALFVLAPAAPGKKPVLLHVLPYDAKADQSPERFVDTMHDFVAINRRVLALEQGIETVQRAGNDAELAAAKAALTALLAAPVALHQPEQQSLLDGQAGPFERRARELTAPPPPPPQDGPAK